MQSVRAEPSPTELFHFVAFRSTWAENTSYTQVFQNFIYTLYLSVLRLPPAPYGSS